MNPGSTFYLYDEMWQVKYEAYPNTKQKNYMKMTMIENLNLKLKNTYNDKYFKKKICSINRAL
jgi:hypothetical protein